MSNFKVKGTITKIGEKKTLDNGATVLDYEVTDNEMYPTVYAFGMYKKAGDEKFVEQFLEFNKVGDEVEVEFTIRSREYNGKVYNNLNHWRCDKVGATQEQPTQVAEDDLPF